MSLKLTYFDDNKGRNELTRLIFAVGGVEYEDEGIGFLAYTARRDEGTLPYGQLPTLAVGNELFGQSCAIARFAARRANLYPTDELEQLHTDAVVDSWRDCLDLFYETIFSRVIVAGRLSMVPHPPSKRHGKLADFVATELSAQLERYDHMLEPTGQLCASLPFPCWADLAVYDLVKTIEGALEKSVFTRLLKGKRALASLVQRVDELEPIKKHLAIHPYKDISGFFKPVHWWKRVVEAVQFPLVRLVIAGVVRFRDLTRGMRTALNSAP